MSQSSLTQLIQAMNSGDKLAANELFGLVYEELRSIAYAKLARERKGHTLQPTALVHEVWIRLVGSSDYEWKDRKHFLSTAAEAMRRLLIENARNKKCSKRGGAEARRVELGEGVLVVEDSLADELLDLTDAIERYAAIEPQKVEVVKMKFLLGMTNSETASALGVSEATVERFWAYSRAWLHVQMKQSSVMSAQKNTTS